MTEEEYQTTEEATQETKACEDVAETTENVEEEVEYCCPAEFDEREELRKMFVGGLDKETSDEEFRALFESFGEIKEAAIIKKDDSRSDRLFGFITFAKCDDLDECLLARPHKYKEKELDVKRAVPKGQFDGTGHFKVKKLHLGNIPEKFDTACLLKYLKSRHPKKYGVIEEVDILKAKDESGNATEKNRGFGFITVSSEDFADRIAIAESKFTLDGNALRISKAKPKASEGGVQRGGFKGKGFRGGRGWDDWGYSGYGAGYGYGYGAGYGYGYDYYSYPYSSYGGPPTRGGGGYGRRYAPY